MSPNRRLTALVPVEIIDSGHYIGLKLIPVKRLLSWQRRGFISAWQPKRHPVVTLNAYKFTIEGVKS